MEYDLVQFEKDMEKIFAVSGDQPKIVMCCKCGDRVSTKDGDCSCGYIGRIMRRILKTLEPESTVVIKNGGNDGQGQNPEEDSCPF